MKEKKDKLATQSFVRAVGDSLNAKIDGVEKRLDAKIDRIAMAVVQTQSDVIEIKHQMTTMATKQDINLILDRFDSFAGKIKEVDQEQRVQGLHIKELQQEVKDHERRIGGLEAANQ